MLVLVKVLFVAAPSAFYGDTRMSLFDWPVIAGIGAAGLVGLSLAERSGLAATWDARHPFRKRLLRPLAIGAALAIFGAVPLELAGGGIRLFLDESGLPRFNMPLPASIPFYVGGAIVLEVVYRLLPMSLLYWLSGVVLRGRWRGPAFWTLLVLTSMLEPMGQLTYLLEKGSLLFGGLFAVGFALNAVQGWYFRQSGFLAAIVARLGYYAVWHIGYGNLICNC